VQFYKTQVPTSLFNTTNPEQVEQKLGGTAPNATQFWPPVIPSNNYFVSPDDSKVLITKEKYTSLYKNGHLKNMKVDCSSIIEDKSEELTRPHPFSATLNRENAQRINPRLTCSMGPIPENESCSFEQLVSTPCDSPDLRAKFSNGVKETCFYVEDTDYLNDMDENLDTRMEIRDTNYFKVSLTSRYLNYSLEGL